jgi:tetrahydromethanopterin S-methyltransferase subunit B
MEEIDEIKEKQKELEKVSADLEKSLEFAQESITILTERVDAQAKTISELEKGVNNLTKSASFEKERTIKLESHSRRNNLIFYGIPEEVNETSAKTESLLYSFLEDKLKLKVDDIDGILIERAHRLGKRNANGEKPRPIIAKFSFYKNKEFMLSNARILAGTAFGISQDSPERLWKYEEA